MRVGCSLTKTTDPCSWVRLSGDRRLFSHNQVRKRSLFERSPCLIHTCSFDVRREYHQYLSTIESRVINHQTVHFLGPTYTKSRGLPKFLMNRALWHKFIDADITSRQTSQPREQCPDYSRPAGECDRRGDCVLRWIRSRHRLCRWSVRSCGGWFSAPSAVHWFDFTNGSTNVHNPFA